MNKLQRIQSGMTMGGLIFVLAFIGLVVTFVVRAFPLYNEKMQIVSAMNSLASQPDSAKMSDREMQNAFLRSIQATTNIQRFSDSNVKDYVKVEKPKAKGEPKMLHIQYQQSNKLVADLQLLLVFDKAIPIRGNEEGG